MRKHSTTLTRCGCGLGEAVAGMAAWVSAALAGVGLAGPPEWERNSTQQSIARCRLPDTAPCHGALC